MTVDDVCDAAACLQVNGKSQVMHGVPGDAPAHAGFAGPNTVNGLACDTSLSPLHFEVYEFARRAAPTSTHLLEVRRLLDRVRLPSNYSPGLHRTIPNHLV